ncbi:MAG: lysylphosphatidylglycerol synthase transmembrane domain-containing protein [Solirubrobacteraceae bacterium]
MGSRLSWLGVAISLLALAGVVWWALRQDAPRLPSSASELAAVAGAVALYGVATLVRSERWHRLLEDEGATPTRTDTYALTCVGYMGNNVLPARAGDAIRTVLMAPRARTSMRTVIGTLLAERLLDIAVLVVIFVVVGYGLLGEVGVDKVEIIALAAAGVAVAGVAAYLLVRRNARLTAFLAPMASSTLGLRRAHHGLQLLGITLVIWAIEAAVWMSAGAAVGFAMDPIEGLYIVALASVFSLIPSGPAYAGTQDAAAILGIRSLGGTGAQAVAYIVMLRFVIVLPITIVGLVLLAARYGGLGRLRTAR